MGDAVRGESVLRNIGRVVAAAAVSIAPAAYSAAEAPAAGPTRTDARDPGKARAVEAAMAASRAAVGRRLGDYTLTDTDGRRLRLADLRGRPLVVSLIYTSCFDFCPTLTANLAPKVEIAREALGREKFAVLTIGFDARNDTPARMRAFARMLGLGDSGWLFLSGDDATVGALAADLGFTYRRTAAGYDHSVVTTIVDPAGRVYRQIYGTDFAAPALVEPLKALVLGAREPLPGVSAVIERVRLWCTVYDPRSGRYRIDYSLILTIALGALCLTGFGLFLAREWRKERRARRAATLSP